MGSPPRRKEARERDSAQQRYSEPGQEEGWTWCLDARTGHIRPEPKPGYTGPLPEPVRVARQFTN